MSETSPKTEVILRPSAVIDEQRDHWPGYVPPRHLKKGDICIESHMPLPCDITVDHDVPIPMRDGVTIYADIYRRTSAKPGMLPALVMSGPFGKTGGPNRYAFDKAPWRNGCPRELTSGLEKFEGLDPAYWCFHGYAIVHTDPRGTWKSEGVSYINCVQDGLDGYDLVEWLAEQEWCNGKVSFAGNSYLSQTQWFIGAENPPHLACLAPWEGCSDIYNDSVRRGGMCTPGFFDGLLGTNVAAREGTMREDLTTMANKYLCWNDYWEDRRAAVEKIRCPLYVVASWTSQLHTHGTFRGYTGSSSTEKWLRVHNSHEWPDLCKPENVEDLRRFFDYYMKGVNNGWNFTPKVRISVLNAGHLDVVNRPESEFPLARQIPYKLYLDPENGLMSPNRVLQKSQCSYDATSGQVLFSHTFTENLEFTGYMKLRLWVQAVGSDDMDIFIHLNKYNGSGKKLESATIDTGYMYPDPEAERREARHQREADPTKLTSFFSDGPMGRLRVSHRALDQVRSTEYNPVLSHEKEELLKDGEVVPVDIAFWPYGMIFEQGETMTLVITGVNRRPKFRPTDVMPVSVNRGTHVIHSSEVMESFLLLPCIPTR